MGGCLDGLELDDETLADQQVNFAFTDAPPFVVDGGGNFDSERDVAQSQLDGHRPSVH